MLEAQVKELLRLRLNEALKNISNDETYVASLKKLKIKYKEN